MRKREITNKKTGEKLVMFEDGDFEFEEPIKHYKGSYIVKQMVMKGIPENELSGETKPTEQSKKIFIEATKSWNDMLLNFKKVKLSDKLLKLFGTTQKREQVALLNNVVLNPDIIMALLIKADELGYTLSEYKSEYSQKGLDLSKMPLAFNIKDDGSVKKFGKTELSDGQLKQAIEHRKVKIGKFLDKGDEWHCFFVTFKSLRGEETWLGKKQPHYHYISNAFGIDRNEVVKHIKSEKYKLGNLPHLKLEDYGSQPEKQ
jgi:hypothetical protein